MTYFRPGHTWRWRSRGLPVATGRSGKPEDFKSPGEEEWRTWPISAVLREARNKYEAVSGYKRDLPNVPISPEIMDAHKMAEAILSARLRNGEKITEEMFQDPEKREPEILDYCFANHQSQDEADWQEYVSPFAILPAVQSFRDDVFRNLQGQQILTLEGKLGELGVINGKSIILLENGQRNLYVPVKLRRSYKEGKWKDYSEESRGIFIDYDFFRLSARDSAPARKDLRIYLGDDEVNKVLALIG